MKQTLMTAETLILFALIILFPGVILEGAQAGLLLWFNTVLPALLPFLILSNLLLGSPAIQGFARITGHSRLSDLSVKDLCTASREISVYTDIPHA